MRVTKLIIKNIGLIEDETIELNKPLLLFYGEIRQGKSTILNAVRWVCGGSFPADIIRHGAEEGSIEMQFDGGSLLRSFYRSKVGGTKARDITFVRAGKRIASPAGEIKRLLNPFLLNQDYLKNMGETERRQYFVDTFPVETADLDTEAFNASREAEELRATIKGYGHIDLTPVPESNALELRDQLDEAKEKRQNEIRDLQRQQVEAERAYNDEVDDIDKANEESRDQNTRHNNAKVAVAKWKQEIEELEKQLASKRANLEVDEKILEANPLLVFKPRPAVPEQLVRLRRQMADWAPTSPEIEKLEVALMEAGANEVKRQQFEANKVRAEQKKKDEARVLQLERRQREIKKEKAGRLNKCANVIPGLAFNEEGQFTFEGTDAGMLSTSQVMRLSQMLSDMYPEGFGLGLVDRAESLGKSIYEFIEKAKAEDKTILATIVGEAPASSPPEVGVFIVEKGKVKSRGGTKAPKSETKPVPNETLGLESATKHDPDDVIP